MGQIARWGDTKPSELMARINGEIVHYDAASRNDSAYDENIFRYIGKGYIYSVDGIRQTFKKVDNTHFWVYKK